MFITKGKTTHAGHYVNLAHCGAGQNCCQRLRPALRARVAPAAKDIAEPSLDTCTHTHCTQTQTRAYAHTRAMCVHAHMLLLLTMRTRSGCAPFLSSPTLHPFLFFARRTRSGSPRTKTRWASCSPCSDCLRTWGSASARAAQCAVMHFSVCATTDRLYVRVACYTFCELSLSNLKRSPEIVPFPRPRWFA